MRMLKHIEKWDFIKQLFVLILFFFISHKSSFINWPALRKESIYQLKSIYQLAVWRRSLSYGWGHLKPGLQLGGCRKKFRGCRDLITCRVYTRSSHELDTGSTPAQLLCIEAVSVYIICSTRQITCRMCQITQNSTSSVHLQYTLPPYPWPICQSHTKVPQRRWLHIPSVCSHSLPQLLGTVTHPSRISPAYAQPTCCLGRATPFRIELLPMLVTYPQRMLNQFVASIAQNFYTPRSHIPSICWAHLLP